MPAQGSPTTPIQGNSGVKEWHLVAYDGEELAMCRDLQCSVTLTPTLWGKPGKFSLPPLSFFLLSGSPHPPPSSPSTWKLP